MPKFLDYNPQQVYLLPPSVRDVLGENHACFFLHQAVEALELSAFEQGYADDGRPAYHPALMLKVWLYAYALGSPRPGGWSSGCGRTWPAVIWRLGRHRTSGR